MNRRPRRTAHRDQDRSSFSDILESLLAAAPGVLGAALVDQDGETVDYAGEVPPFDIRVAAAHFRIILDQVANDGRTAFGTPREIAVRADRRTFIVRQLAEGYALVVLFARRGLVLSARAIERIERELSLEAGWDHPPVRRPSWHPIEVETAGKNRRRPLRVRAGSRWEPVEVIGRVVGPTRDRGYRVALQSGAELTLVREPQGSWYSDEPILEIGRSRSSRRGPLGPL
jgi:predicted regulator of Ras-like GTPase activity (Roadblock/LC7/MglB family)